jgi:hypothetical protein
MTREFEHIRRSWYEKCAASIYERWMEALDERELNVVSRGIGGLAEQALRAQQLMLCHDIVERRQYLDTKSSREFLDIMSASVCGGDLDSCRNLIERYRGADQATGLFRFSADVARHIVDLEKPLMAATIVAAMFQSLVVGTRFVVASSFGDSTEVARLTRLAEQGE